MHASMKAQVKTENLSLPSISELATWEGTPALRETGTAISRTPTVVSLRALRIRASLVDGSALATHASI
jgi:hypothetical protein